MDFYDVPVVKAGQCLRFIEKARQPPFVIGFFLCGFGEHGLIITAYCQVVGQVLLDGHGLVQVMVIAQVGNPEPTAAQDPHQFIFFDAVARRQGMEIISHRLSSRLLVH